MATFRQSISNIITARAVVAMDPRRPGSKLPLRPARTADRRTYVTIAITGMYMSGEFMSSRGGR